LRLPPIRRAWPGATIARSPASAGPFPASAAEGFGTAAALHQSGAGAIISGLEVPLTAALPIGDPPGRRAAARLFSALQPESSHRSLSGKGAQRALCRFRGVMFPCWPRPAPNHRDQGRL
jgi:hypothetical protein